MSLDIRENSSLMPFHSFGFDCRAKALVEVHSIEELKLAYSHPNYLATPKVVLGGGSNTVFTESFEGLVIVNRIMGKQVTETDSAWTIHVGSGENWHDLVMWSLQQQIFGLENLALIPGTVGAAPVQNIGAYGVEFGTVCDYVDALCIATGEVRRLSQDECQFAYRDSIFKGELKGRVVIVGVGIKLSKQWRPNLGYGALAELAQLSELDAEQVAEHVIKQRDAKLPDPAVLGNAGSFFKNPVVPQSVVDALEAEFEVVPVYPTGVQGQSKLAAGWLIDKAGLKGKRFNGVGVHIDQALVLVNHGEGTASELIELAGFIVAEVKQRFGVTLEPEVRLLDNQGNLCWKS